jgi:hypothetical protein
LYNLPAVASNWFDKKWLMTEKQKRKIEEMIFSKLPGLSKNNKNVLYALFYNQDFNLLLVPLQENFNKLRIF